MLKSPANRHKAVGLTFEQWRYAFTNAFSEDEARELSDRYHIPANGGILWGSVLEDHIMPPAIQQSNLKHYKSNTVTEIREYEGYAHLLPAQEGWERIADEVLAWAVEQAS